MVLKYAKGNRLVQSHFEICCLCTFIYNGLAIFCCLSQCLEAKMCSLWSSHHTTENFLKMVITGGKSWVYGYDLKIITHHSVFAEEDPHLSNPPKSMNKSKQCEDTINSLFFFFNQKDIGHHEHVSPGQTVNKKCYCDMLQYLQDAVHRKRTELHVSGEWEVNHSNTHAHSAQSVQQFFTKLNILQI